MFQKLRRVVRDWLFNDRIAVYNGVAVRDRSPFLVHDHEPEFKNDLVNTVRNTVKPGDDVVIVGGGRSVVAVHASRAGGNVTVYEAANEMVSLTAGVRYLNNVDFDIRHAVVGAPIDVFGDDSHAIRVDPASLKGDVLVLDCEGAERSILPDVSGFRNTIVETHPAKGSSTDDVLDMTDGEVVGEDTIDGEVVIA
jgi:hypothetical protein